MVTALVCAVLVGPAQVLANGSQTHAGINLRAVDHLPEGPLKQMLAAPGHLQMLINGSAFPDGGYAIGHPYGEQVHWEPVQRVAFELWRASCPELDEACEAQLVFLLGLVGHGMADQVFDGLFMESVKLHDAAGWKTGLFDSLDSASDVLWAAYAGAQAKTESWLPLALLAQTFAKVGVEVADSKLQSGQKAMMAVVLGYSRVNADNQAKIQEYEQQYPWAAAHLMDPNTFGSPLSEARVVAAYWQHLYAEHVTGAEPRLEVMATMPGHGGAGLASDPADPASRVAVAFSRGLKKSTIDPSRIHMRGPDGAELAVKVHMIYGHTSAHVLRLEPKAPWPAGELELTVLPGAVSATDSTPLLTETRVRFRAGAPNDVPPGIPPPGWSLAQAEVEPDASGAEAEGGDVAPDAPRPDKDSGCAAGHPAQPSPGAAALWLLGLGLLWRRGRSRTSGR